MLSLVHKVESSKGKVNVDVKVQSVSIDPIDPKEAAISLGIENQARIDAESGIPLKSDSFPSASESAIQNYVAKRVNDYVLWGNQRVQFCDNVMRKTQINMQVLFNLQDEVKKFQSNHLKTWLIQYSTDLHNAKKDSDIANKSLEDFREKNDLPREPFKLSPSRRFISIAILFALILTETIINAGLFAKGLERGNLGGIVTAFIAALGNVMISWYLFAQLFRGLLIRCPTTSKYFKYGLTVTLLWLILELMFSFGVAHYRDALEAYANAGFEGTSAAITAAENYLSPLKDLLSWALWLITVAFGSIAYIDGIHMKEPFPGYAQKFEQTKDFEKKYLNLLENAVEDLKEVKNKTVENIQNEINKIDTNYQAYCNAVKDKENAETQFINAWQTSITAYKTMIKQYRQSNTQYRDTKSRTAIPSYFSQPINENESGIWKQAMPDFDRTADQKKLAEQSQLKANVLQDLKELINLLHLVSDKAIEPYLQKF